MFLWLSLQDIENSDQHMIFHFANAYLLIRLISASIDIAKQRGHRKTSDTAHPMKQENGSRTDDKQEAKGASAHKLQYFEEPSILDFVSYSLHFPSFIFGPILTFDLFHPQIKAFYRSKGQITLSRLDITLLIIRIFFWIIVSEISYHFMYVNAISNNLEMASLLSPAALLGLIVWKGLLAHIHYFCMFGIGAVSLKCEGLSPHPLPRCVFSYYRFTDIWKYYDTGYYSFIKRYIYVPIGGSHFGFRRQLVALVTTFAFIFYWHGGSFPVFLWAVGNGAVVVLEMMVMHLLKTQTGCQLVGE